MATRGLLRFNNGVMVYRQWDSYPSNVLSDIKQCIENGVRFYDDSYAIAGFLQQMGAIHQKWLDDYYKDEDKETTPELRNAVLGYGVFYANEEELSELDYGQEYSYILTDKEVKIMKWDFSRCLRKISYETLTDLSDKEITELVKRYE